MVLYFKPPAFNWHCNSASLLCTATTMHSPSSFFKRNFFPVFSKQYNEFIQRGQIYEHCLWTTNNNFHRIERKTKYRRIIELQEAGEDRLIEWVILPPCDRSRKLDGEPRGIFTVMGDSQRAFFIDATKIIWKTLLLKRSEKYKSVLEVSWCFPLKEKK